MSSSFSGFVIKIKDKLPLDFVSLSLANIKEIGIPFWPSYKDYSKKENQICSETKVFLILPSLVGSLFSQDFRYGLHIIYSLSYLKQLPDDLIERVLRELTELGYDNLSKWASRSHNLKLSDLLNAKNDFFPNNFFKNKKQLISFIETRDIIVERSRGLRISVESLISQQGNKKGYEETLKYIAGNHNVLEILLGIKKAAFVTINLSKKKIELLNEVLWAMRQVRVDIKGGIFNFISLEEKNRYYLYEEYLLKQKAGKKFWRYSVTKEGLEYLIKIDIARKKGVYYDLVKKPVKLLSVEKILADSLSKNILAFKNGQTFCVWDAEMKIYRAGALAERVFSLIITKIDVNTTATINREKALFDQMTAELESEKIFNCCVPQVIIDDSSQEIFASNDKNLALLSKKYGVKIIHLSSINREADQRKFALHLAEKCKKMLDEKTLLIAVKNVLEKRNVLVGGAIDVEKMVSYITQNFFNHISGVRNYTLLIVQVLVKTGLLDRADIVMSMDDDAPPETYLLKKKVNEQGFTKIKEYSRDLMRAWRLLERQKCLKGMLCEARKILGTAVKKEEDLYKISAKKNRWTKIERLMEKYFAYSQDGQTGLIPVAVGQISKLSDRYVGPKELKITHQRYESLQLPMPEYEVVISDFIYAIPRSEKKDNTFIVMPVNIFAAAEFIGRKTKNTILPAMYGDLRGTMANPDKAKQHSLGSPDISEKIITYVAYPFINDQDTSAIAQFLRYLEQDIKTSVNLQHTNQSALILEGVGGFTADTYVIFNRSVIDNTIPSPSIGRDLRLEEPPYIKWVRGPVSYDNLAVAFSPIAGAQQREIGERAYVIAKQDFDEQVGGFARKFYEKAVKEYYLNVMDNKFKPLFPNLSMFVLYEKLGEKYIDIAKNFHLEGETRDLALQTRVIRARLLSELGKQLKDKEAQLKILENLGKENSQVELLEDQVNAMSLVLTQFSHFFYLYHAKDLSKDIYSPNDFLEDYFYHIKIKDGTLSWRRVVPQLSIGSKRGIKTCIKSEWVFLGNESGEVFIKEFLPGAFVEIEAGRRIVLSELVKDYEAIVPAVVESFTEEYIKAIENKASDQIAADGEILIFWSDILETIGRWSS